MSSLTIEFFHDVICSFCFPMSYRMRQLKQNMPQVSIVHRSFALVPDVKDFDRMFGSRAAAKAEILGHWQHANQNDDLHRFNIEGMRSANFPFPQSMPGLLAAKAAGLLAGEDAYWDMFDALQNALFVQNKNIEDPAVIRQCAVDAGLDLPAWEAILHTAAPHTAVMADLNLAAQYNIRSVPTLILNGRQAISGAQPLPALQAALQNAINAFEAEAETAPAGASCTLQDGVWQCD